MLPGERTQNLADMKQKISSFIKIHGPTLPIHISKETKTSLLLASAFLADMVSEKSLKISNLKVGGSPVYFLPGQEEKLEPFHSYLKGKEKEAFLKLKQSKVLRDDELEPAIRVALREVKDFAIPYSIKFNDSTYLFWQHFSVEEQEAREIISKNLEKASPQLKQEPAQEDKPELKQIQNPEASIEEKKLEPEIEKEIKTELEPEMNAPKEKVEEPQSRLQERIQELQEIKPEPKLESTKLEPIFSQPSNEKPKVKKLKLVEELTSKLLNNDISVLKIEKSDKKEAILRVKQAGKEMLLFAYDKKRISEAEIIKAYRKASSLNLPYSIILRDELTKKQKEILEAYKSMTSISQF